MKGIDISYHNGEYNLAQAKTEGYDFVIIRAGYTGWGDGVTKAKDLEFENNYKKAKELGVPVGAYYFTIATDYQKGVDEANWLYENCLKGKQFEYPIYIDVEDDTSEKYYYLRNAGKKNTTDGIIGFCDTLEKLGYYVGIYGSDISTFKEMVEINRLKNYDKWVARYGSEPKFVKDYQMWQYSSSEIVAGQATDTNIAYIDYPSIIINKGFNGFAKQNNNEQEPEKSKKPKKEISVGDTVIVNGVGTASSTGEGAKTREFTNQEMKVIMIAGNADRPNRYALNQYNKGTVNDPFSVTAWFSINDIKLK